MRQIQRLSAGTVTLLALMLAVHAAHAAEGRMVLVSAAATVIAPLTPLELRRLYLGVSIVQNGNALKPLRNGTDPLLYEVFLQKVIFLSARNYEHQLLSQVFRQGGRRPPLYRNADELLAALRTESGAVTYMWANTAEALPGIRIIGDIWQGATD